MLFQSYLEFLDYYEDFMNMSLVFVMTTAIFIKNDAPTFKPIQFDYKASKIKYDKNYWKRLDFPLLISIKVSPNSGKCVHYQLIK